jgi:SAM-dependent methyltransferase
MIDQPLTAEMLRRVAAEQHRFDEYRHPLKLAAKARAIDLLGEKLNDGARVLDVGGEPFYQAPLRQRFEVVNLNLPDDMHSMTALAEFDGVLAMHVLEHSPMPLYVLMLLHRALRAGGYLYVAVPKPTRRFYAHRFGHFAVMADGQWRKLLKTAGFAVLHSEAGKFGWRKRWIEYRFLCQKVVLLP